MTLILWPGVKTIKGQKKENGYVFFVVIRTKETPFIIVAKKITFTSQGTLSPLTTSEDCGDILVHPREKFWNFSVEA